MSYYAQDRGDPRYAPPPAFDPYLRREPPAHAYGYPERDQRPPYDPREDWRSAPPPPVAYERPRGPDPYAAGPSYDRAYPPPPPARYDAYERPPPPPPSHFDRPVYDRPRDPYERPPPNAYPPHDYRPPAPPPPSYELPRVPQPPPRSSHGYASRAEYPRSAPPPSAYDVYDSRRSAPSGRDVIPPPRPAPSSALPPVPLRRSPSRDGRKTQMSQPTSGSKSTVSQTVIFLNLPASADEAALRVFLAAAGAQMDEATIIRDRDTGNSKRFGFVRFVSTEHARSFVDRHWPAITWRAQPGGDTTDDGLKIKMDYSQTEKPPRGTPVIGSPPSARDVANRHASQLAAKSPKVAQTASKPPVQDGTKDVGDAPTPYLLVRNLDPLTTASELGSKLVEFGFDIVHAVLIKDRSGGSSRGYAFLGFRDSTLAQDKAKLPDGLKIRDKLITLDFAHRESFRPSMAPNQHSFQTEDGREVMYWDTSATVGVWTNSSPPAPSAQPADPNNAPTLANNGQAPPPLSAPTSTAEPEDKQPQDAKSEAATASFGPSESVSGISTATTSATSVVFPSSASEPEPVKIESVKAEPVKIESLNPEPAPMEVDIADKVPDPPAAQPEQPSAPAKRTIEEVEADDPMAFADTIKMTCTLCLRQFRTLDDIERHNSLSNLHKTNLDDPAKLIAARERKAEANAKQQGVSAERRQPDKASPAASSSKRSRRDVPVKPAPVSQTIEDSNGASQGVAVNPNGS